MRAIATDWLSHWILLVTGGAVGIYFGWWGVLGALVGWTVMNSVFRFGASNQDRDPASEPKP